MTVDKELSMFLAGVNGANFTSQAFDYFSSGVMIINMDTEVVYYNQAQGQIDDIEPSWALGKTILDLYRVIENAFYPTLHCLFNQKPIINLPLFYYTSLGKLVNSMHSVFPLFRREQMIGCICFIQDYGRIADQYKFLEVEPKKKAFAAPGTPSLLPNPTEIITKDPVMRKGLKIISQSASSPSPTMIFGETGCGKEMFAQAIHRLGLKRDKPFIPINCAAIPESLLEGMLFGTVRGAFTGSMDKPGMLEMADGGTVFLDEINSMPLGLQSKMLRVLQDQKVRRVGGVEEKQVSLKIISATNVHPQNAVTNGSLRADLFFRLAVVMVEIPPLRDRISDIPLLVEHFLKKHNKRLKKNIVRVAPELLESFENYLWPGNVRELEHTLEGAMNLSSKGESMLEAAHFTSSLFGQSFSKAQSGMQIPKPERENHAFSEKENKKQKFAHKNFSECERVIKALEQAGGNAAQAARILGISPQLMNYKLNKYGLKNRVTVIIEKS